MQRQYYILKGIGPEGIRFKPDPYDDSQGDGTILYNGEQVSSLHDRIANNYMRVNAVNSRSFGYIDMKHLDPPPPQYAPPPGPPPPQYEPFPPPPSRIHSPPWQEKHAQIDTVDPQIYSNLYYDNLRHLYYIGGVGKKNKGKSYWASTTPGENPTIYYDQLNQLDYVAVPEHNPDSNDVVTKYYQLIKKKQNGGLRRRKFRSHKKHHVRSRSRPRSKKSCSRRR